MKSNRYPVCLLICIPVIPLLTQLCTADDVEVEKAYEELVLQAGYPIDSINGVIRATEDHNYPVRRVATELLARRYGQRNPDIVLPVLRRLTQDPAIAAKATAAYWVAKFGDASGHEVLKHEYLQRVPGGDDPQRCGEVGRYQVKDALWIGNMLAELGDPIGLALATYAADSEDFDTLKSSSARTLGSIARLRIPCPEQANQAIAALERLVSNNIKPYSLAVILWETERPGFPPEAAARIQETLEQSGRLPPFVSTPRMRERILKRNTPTDIPQESVFSRPAPGTQRPRGVRLDPAELEMPISHRESRVFHVALQGGPETCMVTETQSDDPGIEVAIRGGSDGKGYALDVTVKETTLQNRNNYVIVRLEECERPFLVLPIRYFRQVTTRPASRPASSPATRPG